MDRDNSPTIDQAKAGSRADGRPPEEKDSQEPANQAEAILEDSEERTRARMAEEDADGERGSSPPDT